MNHDKHRHRGKPTEDAFPEPEPVPGAQTHIPRAPVKTYTAEERAAFLASRLDLTRGKR